MATLQNIIDAAYRERQVVDIDTLPTTAQSAEALVLLRGIISRAIVQKPQSIVTLGTKPKTGVKSSQRDFTPYLNDAAMPQNVYVHANLEAPATVLMPFNAGDGARLVFVDVAGNFATTPLTLNGNGSLVDAADSKVLDTNGIRADFMYRRDLAEWRSVAPLLSSSVMPFPEEYDDMFVLMLSARILSRYGREIDGASSGLLEEMRDRFSAQYRRTGSDVESDVLFEVEYTPITRARRGGREEV